MQRHQLISLPVLATLACCGLFGRSHFSRQVAADGEDPANSIQALSAHVQHITDTDVTTTIETDGELHRSLRALSLADPKTVENRVPHQFTTTAIKCPSPIKVPDNAYKSQEHEDAKLMKWFGTLCSGTYIEMGALDGILFSNSHVFNKGGLGWKGVLIELMKHNYVNLIRNRKNEIATINAGVCDEPQQLHYFGGKNQAVGGIYEFTVPSFREKWWKGISVDKMQKIQCDTLDNLLLQYAPEQTFFDFFSLDVEGAELSVLRSIDFSRVGFGIVLLEADQHNELKNLAMRELLESNGYIFLEVFSRSYWFVHHQFHEIYRDLIY